MASGHGFNGPLLLSVELDDGATVADLAPLEAALAADPGIASVEPVQPNDDGTAAVIRAVPDTSPQSAATVDTVHRLRGDVIPAAVAAAPGLDVHVGGQAAMWIDMSERVESRLPWFIGAVLALSVALLMLVFRSIAVPLKAAAMNLLSIGAAYGVIVAVFQWGWGNELFGLDQTLPVVSFVPMMLFAVLFGLSMDYEVFLLSRVREEYLRRADNDAAVIEGIASTARVITSAALIMISVFAAFVLSVDPIIKMFGLGLATAVFIDATIVRVVLVPATMTLLGDRNWWLPEVARPPPAQPRRRGRRGPAGARLRARPRPGHHPRARCVPHPGAGAGRLTRRLPWATPAPGPGSPEGPAAGGQARRQASADRAAARTSRQRASIAGTSVRRKAKNASFSRRRAPAGVSGPRRAAPSAMASSQPAMTAMRAPSISVHRSPPANW